MLRPGCGLLHLLSGDAVACGAKDKRLLSSFYGAFEAGVVSHLCPAL